MQIYHEGYIVIVQMVLVVFNIHHLSYTAAINVTTVTVDISPSDDDIIPVVLGLQDDSIVEPIDLYQVTVDNISDPNVVVGEENVTFIIVNDDDIGKIIIIYVNSEL